MSRQSISNMTVAMVCPPMVAVADDWKYAPYHTWRLFSFAHGDYGYSGCNLGISSIASYLRARGTEVLITDGYVENISVETQVQRVMGFNPDVIGVTMMSNVNQGDVGLFVRKIREEGFFGSVIVGGLYPGLMPQKVLEAVPSIDAVTIGDGELAMEAVLLNCCGEASGWEHLIIRRSSNAEKINGELCSDINTYPPVARDLLSIEVERGFVPGIPSSRGCGWQCSFCSPTCYDKRFSTKAWRAREFDSVCDEIAWLSSVPVVSKFKFVDLNFLNGPEGNQRALEIAHGLKKRGIHLPFMCDARVDCLKESTLKELKDVGLWGVYLGLESPSQRQLELFRKRVILEDNNRAVGLIKSLGLRLLAGTITFEPSTSREEVRDSLRYLESIGGFNIYRLARGLIPREGTELFNTCLKDQTLVGDGYDYTIRCKDPWVQSAFEWCDTMAMESYKWEMEGHDRLVNKFSISGIPNPLRAQLRILESHFNSILLATVHTVMDEGDYVINTKLGSIYREKCFTTLYGELNKILAKWGA